MKNDNLYIDQMLDSIQKIKSFVKEVDKGKFLANRMIQSAVIMQLMLIGEISKKILEETKSKIVLPWKKNSWFQKQSCSQLF